MKSPLTPYSNLKVVTACSLTLMLSCSKNDSAQTPHANSTDPFANEVVVHSLVDFDSTQQLDWLSSASADFSTKHQAQGKNLEVEFSSEHNISALRIQPNTPWDLAAYKNYNLAFDVDNTGDESIHLYLSLENPQGEIQKRSISLPVDYSGTVYFPLKGVEAETATGLWGDAPPWKTKDSHMVWRSWRASQVNLNTIKSLTFSTIGTLVDKKVAIDNIRLRQNPQTESDWLVGILDKFGQNAKLDTALKVHSEEQLKSAAQQELSDLAKSSGMPDRSRFGGYTAGPKLAATGYFRTEKVDGKWWMVDPDGYLYFSHGPANVRMANLTTITGIDYQAPEIRVVRDDETTPEDSMGIIKIADSVKQTRFVTSEVRNNMFEWLPSYDDPLADHYSYRRSTHKGPVAHGETYSFYRANLERRYGETEPESYVKDWHQVTLDRMRDWGFTSFGNWVDPAFYEHEERIPYFANGWIIGNFKTLSGKTNHWGLMPDPYDPVFTERAFATIEEIAENVKSSPWCVGIFIDNEKSWGEREGSVEARYGVILDALSKSVTDSPAKSAFTKFLTSKYSSIAQLNQSWNTELADWSELENGVTFTGHSDMLIQDLSTMLEMLGEQYFTVVHNTLEQVLPHHLYMGARMANWGMPDEIIKASLKYSDVLSFNIYEEGVQEHFWKFLEDVDLPVTIGEFHIGTATDSGLFNYGIVHAANQTERANMYRKYMASVLDKPYMVGAHWFQYVDEPITGRSFDGENANIGFVTVTDIPYPELIQAVKDVTSTMYPKRYGK
ncbi:agarase [Paraglaciecola aquimarina]|uniref:Agarase n=1 Tax=Paraglaciecola aquimarina TaxID=1235557 RepID=A0ABU3SUV7_9ALTE|nr:agarase [Paraglaciecola aquimarina]MDU0353784.1 agarase [Paraglaciecola aquimarina]